MQCQVENYNPSRLINEMNEKFKLRSSHSKMCLFPTNQDERQDATEDSEGNFDKGKQCSKSLLPENRPRFRPNLRNLFKRESKPALKERCAEDPPPQEHTSEPYNLYQVPVLDDKENPPSSTSRFVDIESDIYEEVLEQTPLEKTSSLQLETKEAHHQAESDYQYIAVRPLASGSHHCTTREQNLPKDGDADFYDSVALADENVGNNYNLNSSTSSLCEAERVPVLPIENRKPLHTDSSVSKKPPPVRAKTVFIKRNSSKKIQEEWCKISNDSTSQLSDKPLPPVPAQRRCSSLPPNKNLAEFPRKKLPEIPYKELPEIPHKKLPEIPYKELPVIPHKKLPEIPHKELPEIPHKELPEIPHKELPEIPHKELPEIPHKELLEIPHKELPEIPHKELTKIPHKELTEIPHKELPEIEEKLQLFRELLKEQKNVDITQIVISDVNFTGRMVDSRGGRLQLKSHGVVLYIPPGALGDEPREIFIYVQQNLQSSHHTLKDEFVSPVVHCGTSGLKFNIPVILTFPLHVKDSSQWDLTGVRQDSSTTPWEGISDRSRDTMLLNGNLCTVVVDHFTGFGAVGRPTESQASGVIPLRVKAYISHNNAVHGCVELRVYFCDESRKTCESIKKREEGSKLLWDKLPGFFLHINESGSRDADLDVTFELECLNKPWRTSFKRQILSVARCEPYHQLQVEEFCTLNLKIGPQDAAPCSGHQLLDCKISICQSSYENCGVTVPVVDMICVQSGRESTSHCSMTYGIRMNDFDPMSLGRFRKLSKLLDLERRWKLLVKSRFISQAAEQDFDNYVHPSTAVLGIIFSQVSKGEPSMTTLKRLKSILIECNLDRAAQIVHEDIVELSKKYSGEANRGHCVYPVQCSDDLRSHSDEANLHRPTQTPDFNDGDHYEVVPSDLRNHLQYKIPEEIDEYPDQIHTLLSSQFISTNTGPNNSVVDNSVCEHQNPQPIEDDWPFVDEESDSSKAYRPQIIHYQNLPKPKANFDESSYVRF